MQWLDYIKQNENVYFASISFYAYIEKRLKIYIYIYIKYFCHFPPTSQLSH